MDDLEFMLAEEMRDPDFARAYAEAQDFGKTLKDRLCPFGNCVEWFDPETGEIDSSYGPVSCPCQD